jgi:hypothetical protein
LAEPSSFTTPPAWYPLRTEGLHRLPTRPRPPQAAALAAARRRRACAGPAKVTPHCTRPDAGPKGANRAASPGRPSIPPRVVRSDSGGGGRGGGSCRPGYVHPAGNSGFSRGQPHRGGIEQSRASATFGKKRCTGHDRCRDRARLARSRSGIPYARYPLWPQSPADGLLFGCIGLPLSGHSVDDHRRLRRLEAQVSDALPDGDLRAERLGEPLQT